MNRSYQLWLSYLLPSFSPPSQSPIWENWIEPVGHQHSHNESRYTLTSVKRQCDSHFDSDVFYWFQSYPSGPAIFF